MVEGYPASSFAPHVLDIAGHAVIQAGRTLDLVRLVVLVVAICIVASCSGGAEQAGSEPAPQSGTTTPLLDEAIVVRVQFPTVDGILVGPATGHVLDETGSKVASLKFGSGWVLPERWGVPGATAAESGAPTMIDVDLPQSGPYTFVLDEFGISNNPCGTCEQGFAGGSIAADVEEGAVIVLPAGEGTWVS